MNLKHSEIQEGYGGQWTAHKHEIDRSVLKNAGAVRPIQQEHGLSRCALR